MHHRVALFTDTLGDVNGVARFITDLARRSLDSGRDLRVITSTRLAAPNLPNIVNLPPRWARPMPRYPNLELVAPPLRRARAALRQLQPQAVHVSTPGPVGLAGRMAARAMGLPLLGTYHTDFPAYVHHLFHANAALTDITTDAMRWFYAPFGAVLARSRASQRLISAIGVGGSRSVALQPGIEVDRFRPWHSDPAVWGRLGIPDAPGTVRVLYCGRVSLEKNLAFLTQLWPRVRAALQHAATPGHAGGAQLVVVGDGPYLSHMRAALAPHDAHFLGFRHGRELSTLYASSHIFVFPSTTDTLGQAVMEALASGLPAVVGDLGGPCEVVAHGRTGLVLRAPDSPHDRAAQDRWAAALLGLITDRPRREAMSRAAADAMTPMTIQASVDHWWRLHDERIGARHSQAQR
ncbi:MAG: glycosyltransferase family 1 protein [Planctomyces sp.]|nr:glycosyltransferase family 1 protein [Planctomyces sp.]MBA4120154.1 glycosyltransferase family 1 protein [Isosphaera sp.]